MSPYDTDDVIKSFQTTSNLMNSLLEEIRSNASTLAVLDTRLNSISEDLHALNKIILGDNGTKSVLTRLALMEQSVSGFQQTTRDIETEMNKCQACNTAIKNTLEQQVKEIKHKVVTAENADQRKFKVTMGSFKLLALALPGLISAAMLVLEYFFKK